MVLTETEASTKLCPQAIGPGRYEWETVPAHRLCAGSHCMAWRWTPVMIGTPVSLGGGVMTTQAVESPTERSADRGYCGLAGRP